MRKSTSAPVETRSRTARESGPRVVLHPLGLRTFPGERSAVGAVRRWARRVLARGMAGERLDDAVLLLSELAANAVVHAPEGGRRPVTVRLSATAGRLLAEVSHPGNGAPALRVAAPGSPGGRGLLLVDLLSSGWGVHRTGATTTVWFLIGPWVQHGRDGARSEAGQR
ncbi:ATP-binding protein [Sphaerisporangium krabiense]|uniref:Anti-sigma regulatory factor (Ser/Thr protein kinase) n=1 Tax=Sphaerisporangium krabiense TaxID=763782 RepID=A0A7W8Z3L0_9ACTN|nr:ATP-binding protein [Sphaerisporangium krabiense]MBB5626806.1 anti-sigma regulatory factor (Ser/Thr protein kinase) [Sphaerisporangium krabiense]